MSVSEVEGVKFIELIYFFLVTSWRRHERPDDEEENEHSHDGSQSLDQVDISNLDRLG